jgi:carbon monoxide dehydrogenase subunit G
MSNVLVERTFEVPVPVEEAWSALGDVKTWPVWAPHIASVQISPDGPASADTTGRFRFRPVGRSRFVMTDFDPPRSWTWSGRAMGVMIDYAHGFEAVDPETTRLVWTVRSRGRTGLRARLFAVVYSRLIDRAWPRFQATVASQRLDQ